MAQRENEIKYELTEQSYQALLSILPAVGEPKLFTNVYYKAALESGRRDWVLRLRRQDNEEGAPGELTLKVGRQTSPGAYSSMEYTAFVNSSDPADWEDTEPLRIFRQEISQAAILAQGQASNQRQVVQAPLGPAPHWEVDSTLLPNGKRAFELEIEFPTETAPKAEEMAGFQAQVEEWMFDNDVRVTVSTKTKYRRFLEAGGFSAP
jgi:hypothetical protein